MANSSRYRVHLRRRREKKTDYQARKGFVLSGKPRLVARSSLNNTVAQIVVAKPYGDVVLASAHTRELINKFGWKASTGNVPSAYLAGYLCGLKAKKNGVSEAILDLGLVSPIKGSKVFATLAGVVDAGVSIPHSQEKIVKDRIKGAHIAKYAKTLGTPEEYAPKFSAYLAKKLSPEKISEHFDEVKTNISAEFGLAPKLVPKPVKVEKVEEIPVVKKVESVPAPAKVETKVEAKTEAEAKPSDKENKPETTVKPKAKKPATKKPAVTKAKAKTKESAAKTEKAKPKAKKAAAKPKAVKKPKAKDKEAGGKPAKRTGDKKA
jgi:large subunit ribosomal protein L18